MKLYLVSTKGFSSYVVADDANEAEKRLTDWIDKENYGLINERTVTKIEVIADTTCKPNSIIYPFSQLII